MRIILLALLSVTCLLSFAQETKKLELIDIFNLEYISDPQISPDGQKIIYVRNFKDIMTDRNHSNLWVINFDGSQNRPLTTGNQNDFAPKWSHDGKKIIYKSNKHGSIQLYLLWLETKSEVKLTNLQQSPGAFEWSPNDQYIVFEKFVNQEKKPFTTLEGKPEGAKWNDPPIYIDDLNYRVDGQGYVKNGKTQLFTLPMEGGTPRQITFGEYDHQSPSWSKNGQAIYFSSNMREDRDFFARDTEIYSVSLKDLTVKQLTEREGPDNSPIISPDGSQIAYLGFDDKYIGYQLNDLHTMDVNGQNAKKISGDFKYDIGNIQWSKDGKGIYFQYDKEGDTKIGYISLSGKVSELTGKVGGNSLGRPYSGGSFTISDDGKYACTLVSPYHPADLGVGEGGKNQRLTRLNDDLFQYKKLGELKEIRYESSYDQQKIQAWYVTPPDFDPSKKYPLILEIHGGPFANYGDRFAAEIQLYAASGYVVLYVNPRGSTGYGEEFANLINHNYPSQDYDDLMTGVDELIKLGFVDENNLFVTGGSGGGVLSAWIVGKTDRFNAAVVAKPVINWYSFVLYADFNYFFTKYWFTKFPWEDPQQYLDRSPISLVGNVKTPTMLLTGEEDYRTPIAESEQYYAALKFNKVETAMVRIPGASHGIAAQPSNLMAKVKTVLAWFEKYRK